MKTETGQLEIAKHPFIPLFNMPLMISYTVRRSSKELASLTKTDKWKMEMEGGSSLLQPQGPELRTEMINKKHSLWFTSRMHSLRVTLPQQMASDCVVKLADQRSEN